MEVKTYIYIDVSNIRHVLEITFLNLFASDQENKRQQKKRFEAL